MATRDLKPVDLLASKWHSQLRLLPETGVSTFNLNLYDWTLSLLSYKPRRLAQTDLFLLTS